MRCYDGAPDSELQALIDDEARAAKQLEKLGVRAVYFPGEGMWVGFKDIKQVTEFHWNKRALLNAIQSGSGS